MNSRLPIGSRGARVARIFTNTVCETMGAHEAGLDAYCSRSSEFYNESNHVNAYVRRRGDFFARPPETNLIAIPPSHRTPGQKYCELLPPSKTKFKSKIGKNEDLFGVQAILLSAGKEV